MNDDVDKATQEFKTIICKECGSPFETEVHQHLRRGRDGIEKVIKRNTWWCSKSCWTTYYKKVTGR